MTSISLTWESGGEGEGGEGREGEGKNLIFQYHEAFNKSLTQGVSPDSHNEWNAVVGYRIYGLVCLSTNLVLKGNKKRIDTARLYSLILEVEESIDEKMKLYIQSSNFWLNFLLSFFRNVISVWTRSLKCQKILKFKK